MDIVERGGGGSVDIMFSFVSTKFLSGYVTEETADLLSQDGCGDPDITPDNNIITIRRKKRSYRNGEALYQKFHLST